jgi:hypothetical protein
MASVSRSASSDPLVLTHAQALLTGKQGTTDYIDADLNTPADIIRIAREELDFSRPVAIMLMSILGTSGTRERTTTSSPGPWSAS